ncbi:MAG TPA: TonB-dependent receptor [Methylomirabilota bacterium]|jgi:outer membrane receptor protein involved in Fe transport
MRRAPRVILLLLLAAGPAVAQEREPSEPPRLEPVIVTVTRFEQRAEEAPASVTVVTRDDLRQSASQTVDDLLRQVPGFSLFRRTSSVVGHPTTQGVSLRGIGPSGTSRALVLVDGIPANDAFGGWVYWNRMPMLGIEQIEVVRGGGSSVWGNYAVGGVINVLTRRPTERAAFFEGSYGSFDTYNVDLLLTEVQGPFRISLEGNRYETGGYKIVKDSRRGAIDIDADSAHTTVNVRAELVAAPDATFFLSGNYYEEDRNNGTALQFNRTDAGAVAFGGRLGTIDAGELSFSIFGETQEFRSTFSTQAPDRNSETLALDQRVPTVSAGGLLQWGRRFGDHLVGLGGDVRWVEGVTVEKVFNNNVFLRRRVAGGQQVLAGVFVQDVWKPMPMLELLGGARLDYWTAYDAERREVLPAAGSGVPPSHAFGEIQRLIFSPRAAALIHATPTTDVRLSAYQGFRVPTLNELYRVFRVRNDVTVANEHLRPERVTGGEIGVHQRFGPFEGRVTGYWNDVKDLVANVTLTTRLPDCPVGTTCRQRQNLDLARVRGIETELEARLARDWRVIASYLYADARVVDSPQQPDLEGKRLAQVPEHAAALSLRYNNPAIVAAALSARYVGEQYEDDLNTLPLGSYVVFDVALSRALTKWSEVFVAIENIFDRTYSTGRTSEGVVSIGAPRFIRGGLRLAF